MLEPPPPLAKRIKGDYLEVDECAVNPVLRMAGDGVNFHNIYAGIFSYEFCLGSGPVHTYPDIFENASFLSVLG